MTIAAGLAFLLAPILRRRRLGWTVGAAAVIVGLVLMDLTVPVGAGEIWIPVLLALPGLLLAAAAWFAPAPARRRSVS